jgi:hypothetical protein
LDAFWASTFSTAGLTVGRMGESAARGDSPETRTFSSLIFTTSGGEERVLVFLATVGGKRGLSWRARECNDWTTGLVTMSIVCVALQEEGDNEERRGEEKRRDRVVS